MVLLDNVSRTLQSLANLHISLKLFQRCIPSFQTFKPGRLEKMSLFQETKGLSPPRFIGVRAELQILQVQSVLNSARAAQRQESQGPISQALTPASLGSIEAKAIDTNPHTSPGKFGSQHAAATPSTEGMQLENV